MSSPAIKKRVARETRDSIADVWGERTPHIGGEWPARVDERRLEEPERWVQSACVLCSNGCAMDIGVRDGRLEEASWDPVSKQPHFKFAAARLRKL